VVGGEVMTGWVEGGAAFLRGRGLGADDARAVVHAVLAALEGAFVLARGLRSREPFHAAGRALGVWVATLPFGADAAVGGPDRSDVAVGAPGPPPLS
jgi:hypothetical protein